MRSHLLLPTFTALLAGCTVGPNYAGPPAIAPKAAANRSFVRSGDVPVIATVPAAQWWTQLGDQTLDALIARAIAANPDAQIAQARLRQARAALRLQKANAAPSANTSALYAHAHLPGIDFGGNNSEGSSDGGSNSSDLNLYNLGFDASWEIDLFGGQRRSTEAARASAEAAAANLADAQLSLSAEVAHAYVNLRDRQQRVTLNDRSILLQEEIAKLTRQRRDQGTASELDVSRLETQLNNTRAQSAPLKAERDAYLDELAFLVGEEPGAIDATVGLDGPVPLPPSSIAIGDPAGLLRRRPDLRAAERKLAADTAKIGAAEAARFPRISFMGLVGIGGTSLSDLGKLDDFSAIAAPQLSWNFLDFGRNKARVEQARGVRDESEAQYRGAVLGALRDAEDALSRFRFQRIAVASAARAQMAAEQTEQLTAQRYKAGVTSQIDLLDVQRQQIAARQSLLAAQAGLTNDYIAIQKALGLGWPEQPATRDLARRDK